MPPSQKRTRRTRGCLGSILTKGIPASPPKVRAPAPPPPPRRHTSLAPGLSPCTSPTSINQLQFVFGEATKQKETLRMKATSLYPTLGANYRYFPSGFEKVALLVIYHVLLYAGERVHWVVLSSFLVFQAKFRCSHFRLHLDRRPLPKGLMCSVRWVACFHQDLPVASVRCCGTKLLLLCQTRCRMKLGRFPWCISFLNSHSRAYLVYPPPKRVSRATIPSGLALQAT